MRSPTAVGVRPQVRDFMVAPPARILEQQQPRGPMAGVAGGVILGGGSGAASQGAAGPGTTRLGVAPPRPRAQQACEERGRPSNVAATALASGNGLIQAAAVACIADPVTTPMPGGFAPVGSQLPAMESGVAAEAMPLQQGRQAAVELLEPQPQETSQCMGTGCNAAAVAHAAAPSPDVLLLGPQEGQHLQPPQHKRRQFKITRHPRPIPERGWAQAAGVFGEAPPVPMSLLVREDASPSGGGADVVVLGPAAISDGGGAGGQVGEGLQWGRSRVSTLAS